MCVYLIGVCVCVCVCDQTKTDSSEGVDEEEFEVEIVNTYQENPNYSANLEKNVFKGYFFRFVFLYQ